MNNKESFELTEYAAQVKKEIAELEKAYAEKKKNKEEGGGNK